MAEKEKSSPGILDPFFELFSELFGIILETVVDFFTYIWEYTTGVWKIVKETIGVDIFTMIKGVITITYDSIKGK